MGRHHRLRPRLHSGFESLLTREPMPSQHLVLELLSSCGGVRARRGARLKYLAHASTELRERLGRQMMRLRVMHHLRCLHLPSPLVELREEGLQSRDRLIGRREQLARRLPHARRIRIERVEILLAVRQPLPQSAHRGLIVGAVHR